MASACGSYAKARMLRHCERIDSFVEDLRVAVFYKPLRVWFQLMKLKVALVTLCTQPPGLGPLRYEALALPLSLPICVRPA